uniref:Uncharacterized protein n=1 Tax=Arundo donax TaxID=35708 RepID=A0A0A8ZIT0_ARUDO
MDYYIDCSHNVYGYLYDVIWTSFISHCGCLVFH